MKKHEKTPKKFFVSQKSRSDFLGQKKAAIGLSLNFIVIVIISITVLILSIAFIRKLTTGATKTQETYYQQFEKEMESLACDSLDRVCIGKNRKVVGKNGVAVFTMRLLNANDGSPFSIDGNGIENSCLDSSLNPCGANYFSVSLAGTYDINNNEARSLIIVISRDTAPSGTYILDVTVCSDKETGETYCPGDKGYGKEKLYVVVP